MGNHKVFVDLLIESARTYETWKDLEYLGEFMPTDKNAISNALSEIHERIGYQPQGDCMRALNAYADDIVSATQYIEKSKDFLKIMAVNGYEHDAIRKAIRFARQKRCEESREFVYKLVSDMLAEVIDIHRDSIIYDILLSKESDAGIEVILFAIHRGQEIVRSKYIKNLDDVAELSESVYINEGAYDNFKKFKELTRPLNTDMKSVYTYKDYKKPYSNIELETLLRKIYNDNKNH